MELRKPEPFGVLDDHDRRLRNVDAHLDHGGGDHDLRFPALEALHRGVPLRAGHPAVRSPTVSPNMARSASARSSAAAASSVSLSSTNGQIQRRARRGQAPGQAGHHLVEPFDREDAGVDRLSPRRLLAQGGDVHVAEIGEHQRARNRGRGHHQEIDGFALGGGREPLADAKPMLLVDHREPEIGEATPS